MHLNKFVLFNVWIIHFFHHFIKHITEHTICSCSLSNLPLESPGGIFYKMGWSKALCTSSNLSNSFMVNKACYKVLNIWRRYQNHLDCFHTLCCHRNKMEYCKKIARSKNNFRRLQEGRQKVVRTALSWMTSQCHQSSNPQEPKPMIRVDRLWHLLPSYQVLHILWIKRFRNTLGSCQGS